MKNTVMDTEKFNALIGKKIWASGWHYDNGGSISGTIEFINYKFGSYNVYVSDKTPSSMSSFSFTEEQLCKLLEDGELPPSNRLLNAGTDAKVY